VKRVLLVSERSGGHIFPALILAKQLKRNGLINECVEAYFFATSRFLKLFVKKEGFNIFGRVFPLRNMFLEAPYRFIEALYLIFKIRPKEIVGFGGRDGFFLILIGSFFLKTSIYEPNFLTGKANKILSVFVRNIYCGFKEKI